MTPANLCTFGRIVLAPVFVFFFLLDAPWGVAAALAVSITSELSDLADGQLARRRGEVTNLGKLFDPFADSVARYSCFLAFFAHPERYADLWMLIVFFYRDASVSFLRVLSAANGFVLSARLSGKVKAWIQGIAIITTLCLIVLDGWGVPAALGLSPLPIPLIGRCLVGTAAVLTALTFLDYFRSALPHLRAAARPIEGS